MSYEGCKLHGMDNKKMRTQPRAAPENLIADDELGLKGVSNMAGCCC